MASKTKRIPSGYHTITPHIVVRGGADAIDFYKRAFGAEELNRHPGPDGKTIMHAALQIGDSRLFLCDEAPQHGARSPISIGGSPVYIHLYVEDVDAAYQRAVKAGAEGTMPPQDQFWGDRFSMVKDPYGHHWSIASHMEDVTPAEMQKRAAAAFKGGGCGEKK